MFRKQSTSSSTIKDVKQFSLGSDAKHNPSQSSDTVVTPTFDCRSKNNSSNSFIDSSMLLNTDETLTNNIWVSLALIY
jgi:hypothetical protein